MILCKGEISIRIFEFKDIPKKVEWINNPLNNKFLHYDMPLDEKKTETWFLNKDNIRRFDGVIEYNHIPVGLIGLLAIDKDNKKAEFYISMGEHSYKRKGIATKATLLLLEYAFATLELNKVYLNVDEDNVAACALYEKCGFLCEGVFIKDMFHRGQWINRKRYAILKENVYGN